MSNRDGDQGEVEKIQENGMSWTYNSCVPWAKKHEANFLHLRKWKEKSRY